MNIANLIDKGVPLPAADASPSRLGDVPLPCLVLRESALQQNMAQMAAWCRSHAFELAPHGKTTMCPQIYRRQLDAGAWGITVATTTQALVCLQHGVRRVLIANQLVGAANIRSLVAASHEFPGTELYCLVDSPESLDLLAAHWREASRPMNVLVELGRKGWRTGVRSFDAALAIHRALLDRGPQLRFAGFEGFEGSAANAEEVPQYLESTVDFAARFRPAEPLLFSMGGSLYLGEVAAALRQLPPPWKPLLRSGCYVTHDHGYYEAHQAQAGTSGAPVFTPALELWACVQSLPEPGLAIAGFGKRDCSYDYGLPVPLDLPGATVSGLNDQHAFLQLGAETSVKVGDVLRFGISHPCTAFDKWRVIPLVDDAYNILDLYRTYF